MSLQESESEIEIILFKNAAIFCHHSRLICDEFSETKYSDI